mgnify:CR=1 FL=1
MGAVRAARPGKDDLRRNYLAACAAQYLCSTCTEETVMTYVYLQPDDLQNFIRSLNAYAGDMFHELQTIRSTNYSNSDPAGIHADLTDYSPFSRTTGEIVDRAGELQRRLDEAIEMNSSGLTPKKNIRGQEWYSYYLPDEGALSADTADNVAACNHAAKEDAVEDQSALREALKSDDKVAPDGRTLDQILADIEKHEDMPTYGATFVNYYGLDKFLELPIRMQGAHTTTTSAHDEEADDRGWGVYTKTDDESVAHDVGILGRVLAAATSSGTLPYGYDSWAEGIYALSTEEGHRGRMSAVNALLAAPGAVYDTDTLADLADWFEDRPYDGDPASKTPDSIWGWHDDEYGIFYNEGQAFRDGSMDPLYGVLMAMGNNPAAAVRYLAPDGANGESDGPNADRWKILENRSWEPEGGLDAFSAAQSAASTLCADKDPETAAAAKWATSRSMKFDVEKITEDSYTDTMKENFSVMVANNPQVVLEVATGGSPKSLDIAGTAGEECTTLNTFLYRIIDNENAANTIAVSVGNAARNKYADVGNVGNIKWKYGELGAVYGYLEELASKRTTAIDAAGKQDAEERKTNIRTAMTVLTTVIGAGVSAATEGAAAPLIWSVTSAVTTPVVLSRAAPDYKPDPTAQDAEHTQNRLEALAYADAGNHGLLPAGSMDPDHFKATKHSDDKTSSGASGERTVPYSWYTQGGNPPIKVPDQISDDQALEIHDWINNIDEGDDERLKDGVREDVGKINDGINSGLSRGRKNASGIAG